MTDQFDPDHDDLHAALGRLALPGAAPIVVGTPDRPRAVLLPLEVFEVVAPAIDRARTELAAARRAHPGTNGEAAFDELCGDLGADPADVTTLMAEQDAAGFDPVVPEHR
jgi:hypothetical protein